MQPLEKPPLPRPGSTSWLAVLLTTFVVIVAGLALLVLTGGFAAYLLAAAAGVFTFVSLQYLLWGRWLGRMIIREAEQAARQASLDGPTPDD